MHGFIRSVTDIVNNGESCCISLNSYLPSARDFMLFTLSELKSPTISLLQVSSSNSIKDCFRGPKSTASDSVIGIKPTNTEIAVDTIIRYCPQTLPSDSVLVVTAKVESQDEKTKGKLYVTFGQAGVWGKSVAGGVGLLHRMSRQSKILARLVNLSHPDMDFVMEWKFLQERKENVPNFPVKEELVKEPQKRAKLEESGTQILQSNIVQTKGQGNEEEELSVLKQELEVTRKALDMAKERVVYLEKRLELRDNALVNVLIGTHPAFEGLADYPRRGQQKEEKENAVAFNTARNTKVTFNVLEAPALCSAPVESGDKKTPRKAALSRTLSNAQGKAVRVSTTTLSSCNSAQNASWVPSSNVPASKSSIPASKKRQVATPGRTPGARGKTKSRLSK